MGMDIIRYISQIKALALNVWLEAVRDKLLYLLVSMGIVFMLLSLIAGQMAVGDPYQVIQSMGFWIMGIWGLMAVIYMGSNILGREFQRRTIYLVLSRPVNRTTFIIGKFAGMLLVLFSVFFLLVIFWLPEIWFAGIKIKSQHLWALVFIFGEWIMLASFSIFFASFTTPVLHNFFILGISFLGHMSNDLRLLVERGKLSEGVAYLIKAIYFALPNLEALNFRENAIFSLPIPDDLLFLGITIFMGWSISILLAAIIIFSRRKLL